MLTQETKRHIDAARQVLVGVVPNPASQIDQITNALIYKFMDDMDQQSMRVGGDASFFMGELEKYAWTRLMDPRVGNQERMNLYVEALVKFSESKQLPTLFRDIFRSSFLPYRSPEVLGLFLKEIAYFDYSHSEELGNAYEYLLSIMSSQGDAGQFRTPRHIIDFMVAVTNPTKDDKVLDPACGTAGFLISAFKHISAQHDGRAGDGSRNEEKPLTPDERRTLMGNFEGYDIDPGMVRISQVNMYLHGFRSPKIVQYDSLSMDEHWNDKFDVILANPPFMSPKGGIRPHSKFSIESSRSEVLFVDYIMNHLRPKGRAAIIVPEGIIFQAGAAYKQLRKNLVEDGLYSVVSLPSGIFQPYTGVKTSILFFDKELKHNPELLFIDVRNVGVSLGVARSLIEKNDLPEAMRLLSQYQKGEDKQDSSIGFYINRKIISDNGYDLSVGKYRIDKPTDSTKEFVQLAEVCKISKGKSSSTRTEAGVYPLILTAEDSKTSTGYDFEGEGVCIPLISATGHGKASIKRIHYINGRFALANLLAFLEPIDSNKLHPKYLYFVLNRRLDSLAGLMRGAANVSMSVSDLAGFQIPLPPIEIQNEIVKEIEGYQKIINGALQVVENWRPRIEIDPEWERVKLKEICEVKSGGTPSRGVEGYWHGVIPWYSSGELNSLYTSNPRELITEEGLKHSSAAVFPKGSLLVGMYDTAAFKMSILERDAAFNQAICAIKPGSLADIRFLYLFFSMNRDKYLTQRVGVRQLNLSKGFIESIEIPLPSAADQKEIVEKAEAEFKLIGSAKELIVIFEQRIVNRINSLWSKDTK